MPSADEISDTIEGTGPEDWIPFTDMGVWTYEDDVMLRIQRHEQLEAALQRPWTQHLQAESQSFSYLVYYGNSPVEYHGIASVDNFRAHIPLPAQPSDPNEPYTISEYQATLGRIITGNRETFNAYLKNTGIKIRK